jgi:hypothetical protein
VHQLSAHAATRNPAARLPVLAALAYIQLLTNQLSYLDIGSGDSCMQNNNPKSENPATKERAAKAKDEKGRHQKDARNPKHPHAEGSAKHHEGPGPNGNIKSGNPAGK